MTEVRFKDVLSYVGGYWRNYPALAAGLVASMLAATLCDVFMPVLAGRLIDSLSADGADLAERMDGALWALGAFVSLGLAFRIFREGAMYLWIKMATRVMGRIVTDAFYRVQRFSTDWHANSFAGATVRKISRGMWAYDLFADTVYVGFFPAAVVLTGVTTIIFLRWPLMGLAVVAAILLYVAVSVTLSTRYVAPANLRMNEADTAVGGGLADAITCNPTVKAFGAEDREDRRFFALARSWRLGAEKSWIRQTNTSVVQGGLAILIQVALLGMAVWFWAQGRASAGDVTFVLTSFFLINGYLREVGNHVRNMQRAINEMQDIILFSKMTLGVEDAPGARDLNPAGGEIRFESVRFRYDRQSSAIYDDFRLRIAPGERVALVGHSGSGKSTFVKLVQRLYDLESGRILIDGQDIALATQESVRQAIAAVPQEPILFHRSLADNIGYGNPDAGQAAILRAARQAHADRFIAGLAQGYDTLVGERGVKLSGGERQRVAIARAFLADSPILILDEATSSLDSVTEALIQDALERLMEGRTTIVIAHRLSTIQRVDRILVFRDGRVVEQGTHGELLAIPDGHYRELYHVQLRRHRLDRLAGPRQ